MSVQICVPDERDARLIMAWRNDPQTLAAFFHREPKHWSTFWTEYRDQYFIHPNLPPHFVCLNDAPIAFLRYVPTEYATHVAGSVDISLNLAPEARGRRLAAPVLTQSLAFLSEGGFRGSILARIRSENTASCRSFQSVGFRKMEQVMHRVADTGEVCIVDHFAYEIPAGRTVGGTRRGGLEQGCILIDLDGTLADSLPALRAAYHAFLRQFGIPGTLAEFEGLNGPPLPQIVTILQERHRLPGKTNNLLDFYRGLITTAHIRSPANFGAKAFVAAARERGWRIGVVTSSDHGMASAWLSAAGLAAEIDALVVGGDTAKGKPAPDPYLLALNKLGGCPRHSFAIEDSRLGAQAALDAGLETWVISREGPKPGWSDSVFWTTGFAGLSKLL